jgi:hypothetical protein
LAKLMLDTARWVETEWRLVIAILAYIWIFAGIWFTVSPWRFRDITNWRMANETRIRACTGLRVGLGLFLAILGFTAF